MLKPCPFCGKEMSQDNFFSCDGYPQACGCWEKTHTGSDAIDVWNTRPLEDALLARAEAAEDLAKQWREDATNCHIILAEMRARAEAAEKRIAELEAFIFGDARHRAKAKKENG